jgi:hypothetical protein
MKRIAWAVLFLLAISGQLFGDSGALRLDTQGYLRELDRWTTVVQSLRDGNDQTVPTDVPPEWIVTVNGTEHHVSTSFLAKDLTNPTEADSVLVHLRQLREGVLEVSAEAKNANGRAVADNILGRREFRRVRMPGLEQSWRDRFNAWLLRVITKIFGKAAEHVDDLRVLSDIVIWGLLLGAVAALLFWLQRTFARATQSEMRISGVHSEFVSSRPMEAWLEEARQAAGRGDFRLAVRLAYWGAISGLERAGAWKPDRARTPREYLRLTRGSQYEPVLRPLTRDFERVWYAKQPATEADFQTCMARVEELGCQPS